MEGPRDKVAAMLKIIIPQLRILRLVSLLLGPYFNSILFFKKKKNLIINLIKSGDMDTGKELMLSL